MKKLIPLTFIAAVLLSVLSCKSQTSDVSAINNLEKSPNTETPELKNVTIEHLTLETFQSKVFNYKENDYKFLGEKPCIIDFYASWCGPCKIMAPTLQTVADEYKSKITVYKVDVDAQKELASMFGISSIPTLLFCPKNDKPQMSAGLLSKSDLDKAISEVLLK